MTGEATVGMLADKAELSETSQSDGEAMSLSAMSSECVWIHALLSCLRMSERLISALLDHLATSVVQPQL